MKTIYIALGLLFLGLGALGSILPLLPTVPFLLLASVCFARGSHRFHTWFTATALYHNHLKEFEQSWALPLKTKICILTLSTLMMSLMFFKVEHWFWHLCILLLLIIKYYIFIVKIKTISKQDARLGDTTRQSPS